MDSLNPSSDEVGHTTPITPTTATITTPHDTTVSVHFRFLDLPPELRINIYEHLVVVGKVFYTPDDYAVANKVRLKDWKSYQTPSLGILRVCKQIHDEAEEVYLGKNLFVLPDHCIAREPLARWYPNGKLGTNVPFQDRWLFSASAEQLVKKISVAFSPRAVGLTYVSHKDWEYDGFDGLDSAGRMQRAHDVTLSKVGREFDIMAQDITNFFRNESFCYLEIDLTNSYCPTGCCRMLNDSWHQFLPIGLRETSFVGIWHQKCSRRIRIVEMYLRYGRADGGGKT